MSIELAQYSVLMLLMHVKSAASFLQKGKTKLIRDDEKLCLI